MSLREKLQQVRTQTKEEEAAAIALQESQEREKRERDEAEQVEAFQAQLREQIEDLQNKKTKLATSLEQLKKGYQDAGVALKDFKETDENVAGVYEDFKPELSQKGVEDKAGLIKSPEYAEEDEVKKYKKAGANLRGKVGGVRAVKRTIKSEMPDLDFRGGDSEAKEQTPREGSIATIEEKIKELDGQIVALKEQTLEVVEGKKKTAECLVLLQQERRLPFLGNNIASIDTTSLVPQNHTVAYYSKQFGEDSLKRAIFEGLSPQIDEIIKTEKKSYPSSDEEARRARIEKMIRAKIELSICEELERDIRSDVGGDAELKSEKIFEDQKAAERVLPEIVRAQLKYKDRLSEEVQVILAYSSGRFGKTPFRIEFVEAPKSDEMVRLEAYLEKLSTEYKGMQDLYEKESKRRPFFNRERHRNELENLKNNKMKTLERTIVDLKNRIEEQKRRDEIASRVVEDLSRIVIDGKLTEKFTGRGMSIGQLLGQIESFLKENQSKKLTPEEEGVRKQLAEIHTRAINAEREYEAAKGAI